MLTTYSKQPYFAANRINPSPRRADAAIWENHRADWKRLLAEKSWFVWNIRPDYHHISVRVDVQGQTGIKKEDVAHEVEGILGSQYGPVEVYLEPVSRENQPFGGCCGNGCMGCNNGNTERRLYVLG